MRPGRALRNLVLVGVSLGICYLWLHWIIHHHPSDASETVAVEVPRGAGGRVIVDKLEEVGLAPYPSVAFWFLRVDGALTTVQAGVHRLPRSASLIELATLLRNVPSEPQVKLMLIPGESVWQAAKRFEAAGIATAHELQKLAADRAFVAKTLKLPVGPKRAPRADGVAHTYLEGFLFPETYFFHPDTNALEALNVVTKHFARHWRRVLEPRASDLRLLKQRYGLEPHDLLTLASLIERESAARGEAGTIAGVFYNRLDKGMPLQTDPTLVYHPEKVGKPPTPKDRRDARSPYNTYAHRGLPPGPICSPSREAILAALTPERHDYLYFCARRDGSGRHVFARTYDEHRANVARHLKKGQ